MGKTTTGLLIAGMMAATVAYADVMVTKKATYKGSFEGYRDNTFTFRTDKGKVLTEARTNVRKLECDKPRDVMLTIERKPPASMKFLKYQTLKFTCEQDGKKRTLLSRTVESITVPQSGGSGGRGDPAGGVLPLYDVSGLEGRADLTDAQNAALERYKAAKAKYSGYVSESSRIVAEMDRSRGQHRERLMDELRLRKQDEQPVKNEYRAATSALMSQFPGLAAGGEIGDAPAPPAKEDDGWEDGPVQGRALRGLLR